MKKSSELWSCSKLKNFTKSSLAQKCMSLLLYHLRPISTKTWSQSAQDYMTPQFSCTFSMKTFMLSIISSYRVKAACEIMILMDSVFFMWANCLSHNASTKYFKYAAHYFWKGSEQKCVITMYSALLQLEVQDDDLFWRTDEIEK